MQTRRESLEARFYRTVMPFDEEAERCAIGALLIAPAPHAKRIGRKLWREHFWICQHGWLWERATYAMGKIDWQDVVAVYRWMRKDRWAQRYHERFGGRLSELVASCVDAGFWWHGPYYCDRVIRASKLRGRIKRAVEDLTEALNVGTYIPDSVSRPKARQ